MIEIAVIGSVNIAGEAFVRVQVGSVPALAVDTEKARELAARIVDAADHADDSARDYADRWADDVTVSLTDAGLAAQRGQGVSHAGC